MSITAVSKCPFLGRVSTKFLRNAGGSLGMYGQSCPVMSRLFHSAMSGAKTATRKPLSLGEHNLNLLVLFTRLHLFNLYIYTCTTCPLTIDRFYQTVHPGVPRSSAAGGHCPFRAVLQTQGLRTSTTEPTAPAPAPAFVETREEKPSVGGGNVRSQEECKCVSEGLRPKGKA